MVEEAYSVADLAEALKTAEEEHSPLKPRKKNELEGGGQDDGAVAGAA